MCLEELKNSKTIEELYSLYEDEMHCSTAENKEIIEQMLKIEEPFCNDLTKGQRLQFEQIMELEAENGCIMDQRIFTFAFKLAVKLIFESIN